MRKKKGIDESMLSFPEPRRVRSGDEAGWWSRAAIDTVAAARRLWIETHPLIEATSA